MNTSSIATQPHYISKSTLSTMVPIMEKPFESLTTLLRMHARKTPDHIALLHDGHALSYSQLDALTDQVASALQRDGLMRGHVVATCAAMSITHVVIFLGCLRAGIVVAPLAYEASVTSLADMLDDSQARIVFIDRETDLKLLNAPSTRKIAIDGGAACPSFEAWLAKPGSRPKDVGIWPDLAFNILYSAAPSGEVVGIVHPHAMRWEQIRRSAATGYDEHAVTLLATPLHANVTLSCLFPALGVGGTVVMMSKFDATEYLSLAQKYRVTHTMLGTSRYRQIMECAMFGQTDLSSFRMKCCAGPPLPAGLRAALMRMWPGALIEYYGMAEGGGICVLASHEHPEKLHTVGRPASNHDFRLVDSRGREVGPGETGEVVGRSPAMMAFYHRRPDQTAKREWYSTCGRRFIRTGDIGRFDNEGFLMLIDRNPV